MPNERWTEEEIAALKRKQQRLAAYRSMIFWTYPDIKKKERRPLPSCLYMLIRAMFPPTDDEELFADFIFTKFIPEAQND